ncbi:MAG: DNA-binding domain-containing protein [Rhodobacteraceae bacterium]|nr:DNA-binding domain-containing protein [Paracoccaceae bacterium]
MKPFNGEFIEALLKPDKPVPPRLTIPHDKIDRRFLVYRNNVVASLIEGLEVSFPVIRKLVGDEFFKAMAGVYVRAYPPSSPLMMFYGKEMPEFLKTFPPVQHLAYLSDVAELENELRESYHSGDSEPIDPKFFEYLAPEEQLKTHLEFSPAVRLFYSKHPVASIWDANTGDRPSPKAGEEFVLIVRPDFDPYPVKINRGGYHFVKYQMEGDNIGMACEKTLFHSEEFHFDLADLFRLLLTTNSISNVVSNDEIG